MLPYIKISEQEVLDRLEQTAAEDVRRSLCSVRPGIEEFLHLLSGVASSMLDDLTARAAVLRKMHYGKTVKLYTPLYLSNYCINNCIYCGFNSSTSEKRRRLSVDDALCEAEAVKKFGVDSILLVSGEDKNAISADYLAELASELRKSFSYIAIEIYPMEEKDYRRLFDAGVDGLTLYQETYDRETYKVMHPAGPKSDYDQRLRFIENGARAGFRTLGLGVLLGLYDWRIEAFSLAAHALWLKKHFWKCKIQFSFPRITAAADGFKAPFPVSERELEQMILAFRIMFPESEISISTRETARFRDRIVLSAASTLSAASSVVPGGYSEKSRDSAELSQFSLYDTRSVKEMDEALTALGLDVVYKDWDRAFLSAV